MRTRTRITLAGLALGVALVGGVAWATIPGAGGLYTACKLNATGTIRLIDPSGPSSSLLSRCTSYETKITWSQQGPPGLNGAAGTDGADGAAGATGPKGADGANGVDGEDGPAGPAGPAGAKGADGTNGANGTDGAQGAQGPQGPTGPQGATGPAGGVSGYQILNSPDATIPALSFGDSFVACPAGKVVIGGGVRTGLNDWFADGSVADSYPKDNGWFGRVYNPDINLFVGLHYMVFVICANA